MGNLLLLLWVERKEENINGQSNLISRRSPEKKGHLLSRDGACHYWISLLWQRE
jgi:hypothetical protein